MNLTVLGICGLIVLARIADVTLGTLRTIMVVNGRRGIAFILGFFEILIWIMVVSNVMQNLSNPTYAVAYALGFATGNYIGITLDRILAFGEQVVRVFTRRGEDVASDMRREGYVVTRFIGDSRDGPVDLLFIQSPRRMAKRVAELARKFDPESFIVVDDVRPMTPVLRNGHSSTPDYRSISKRK